MSSMCYLCVLFEVFHKTMPFKVGLLQSLVWNFFREGGRKEEKICQLCPKPRVMKIPQGRSTSNLMRHVKRFHPRRLIEEQSKQAVRKLYDTKMIMEEREAADVFDAQDDEDEVIQLISEPLF